MSDLYETDLAAWAEEQVRALRRLADLHPELLDAFPEICPFTVEQALDDDFLPG